MRNAPAEKIITRLLAEGAKIKAFDPKSMEKAKETLPEIEYCDNPYQAAEGADALVIITEWNEFKEMDLGRIKDLLNQPIILDGRNIYDPAKMEELGFIYKSVGR